jgi:hypothetical protein
MSIRTRLVRTSLRMTLGGTLGCVLLACATSFSSVDTTAKIGAGISTDPLSVNQWVGECEALHPTKTDMALETLCRSPKYKNMAQSVRDAAGLLQQYGTALKNAAEASDVTVASDVTAVETQLGTLATSSVKNTVPGVYNLAQAMAAASSTQLVGNLTVQGATTLADTIMKVITSSIRRGDIAEAVTNAAQHVDTLSAFLDGELRLHLADLSDLRKAMDDEVSARPLVETTPAVAQALPITIALVDARIQTLTELDAVVQSFRKTHATLAAAIKANQPWKNGELLKAMAADVKTIVGALNGSAPSATGAATTPGASGDGGT